MPEGVASTRPRRAGSDEDRLVERVERGRYRILDPLMALHLRTVHGDPVRIDRPR